MNNNSLSRFYIFFKGFFPYNIAQDFFVPPAWCSPKSFSSKPFWASDSEKNRRRGFSSTSVVVDVFGRNDFLRSDRRKDRVRAPAFCEKDRMRTLDFGLRRDPEFGDRIGSGVQPSYKTDFFLISNSCFGNFWTLCWFVYFNILNMQNFKF